MTTPARGATGSLLDKNVLFLQLLEASPDAFIVVDETGAITLVNAQAEKMFGYPRKDMLGKRIEFLIPERYRQAHAKKHIEFFKENKARAMGNDLDLRALRKGGSEFPVDISLSPVKTKEGSLVIAAIRDITERKRLEYLERKAAEQRTQLLKEEYQRIVETAEEGIWQIDAENRTTFVNPKLTSMLGYSAEEMIGRTIYEFLDEEAAIAAKASLQRRQQGISEQQDFRYRRKDGSALWAIMAANPILENGKYVGALAMVTDITKRKEAEQALEKTREFTENIIQTANVIFLQVDLNGKVVKINEAAEEITGYTNSELVGTNWSDKLVPRERYPYVWEEFERIATRGEPTKSFENPIVAKSGEERYILWKNNQVRKDGKVVGVISFGMDITEQKQILENLRKTEEQNRTLYKSAQNRLERTVALHNIDVAIANSLNLKFTLNIVLDQVIHELQVDAADILLYDGDAHVLEFLVGKGFRTSAVERARVSMGRGFAGRAVLERKRIDISDLRKEKPEFFSHPDIALEGFIDYHVVPLISKGNILGVLGTFKRSEFTANPEWLDYLETLAGQAAIAIDNILLFENLQTVNNQLLLGYDATIEGWSRALDLRDKETEGHTQRVASLAIKLARQMGIHDEELVHMRRGALLHDIGKMGVPDSILHKPGELNAEEWVIMKKHPQFAYDMLSPIYYLHDALDIPYYHHEKWDGSGYPKGLKAEEIPLAARIFAVVDVYDALTSDRPYRKALSKEKTLEYIKEQSGRHFDPKVVETFLEMIQKKSIS